MLYRPRGFYGERGWGAPSRLGIGVCLSLLLSIGSGRAQALARHQAVTQLSWAGGRTEGAREGSFVKQVEFVPLITTASASMPSYRPETAPALPQDCSLHIFQGRMLGEREQDWEVE